MTLPRPTRSCLAAYCAALLAMPLAACDSRDKAPPVAAAAVERYETAICVNGKCAAIDQAGVLKIPFDNPFDNISATLLTNTVLVAKDKKWYFPDPKTGQLGQPFADEIRALLPGFVGYLRGGHWGVIDAAGHDVQPPRFESVDADGQSDFMTYQAGGKVGLLDAQGQVLTEPVYDSVDIDDRVSQKGKLVMAQRGDEHWVVNLGDRTQKKVDYESLGLLSDDHMVATGPNGKLRGLVDAHGSVVIPLKYDWLGEPAGGLISFRQGGSLMCGYLDYTGKVKIPAHLADCGAFGKKGALASTELGSGGDKTRKYGLLDRDDRWAVQPVYDSGGPAGRTVLGMLFPVPGFASIGKHSDLSMTDIGIFDTDTGRELIAPIYQAIGVLTPDRFVFSTHDSPKLAFNLLGQVDTTPAVGVMTAQQKVLSDAVQYVDIRADRTGPYLRGADGAANPHQALLDLNGHALIALQWNRLMVDKPRAVVFGYAVQRTDKGEVLSLRAAYDLNGKPIFSVMTLPCGAEQLIDAAGKPVWPLDPNPYCTKAEKPLN